MLSGVVRTRLDRKTIVISRSFYDEIKAKIYQLLHLVTAIDQQFNNNNSNVLNKLIARNLALCGTASISLYYIN